MSDASLLDLSYTIDYFNLQGWVPEHDTEPAPADEFVESEIVFLLAADVRAGNYPAVRAWLESGHTYSDCIDDEPLTPLCAAVLTDSSPDGAVIAMLLADGAGVNCTASVHGCTALHFATMISDADRSARTVEQLLEAGADYSILTKLGDSVIHTALHSNTIKLLLLWINEDEFSVNAANHQGNTILHRLHTYPAYLHFILAWYQKTLDVNAQNANGDTALHLACASQHVESVRILLRHLEIDISRKNKHGATPVSVALGSKNMCILEALLTHQKPSAQARVAAPTRYLLPASESAARVRPIHKRQARQLLPRTMSRTMPRTMPRTLSAQFGGKWYLASDSAPARPRRAAASKI